MEAARTAGRALPYATPPRTPTELGRQEKPALTPPARPPRSGPPPAAGGCPAGAERSARQPGPTCLRCARLAEPGSTGQAVGPNCALPEPRLSVRPPSRHFRITAPAPGPRPPSLGARAAPRPAPRSHRGVSAQTQRPRGRAEPRARLVPLQPRAWGRRQAAR